MDAHLDEHPGDDELAEVTLPIRPVGIDDHEARYANFVHVTFDRASFHITFSQFLPPFVSGPADTKHIAEQGFVPAKVISRLVFTPLMVEQTIELLNSQLEKYRDRYGAEASGDGEGEGSYE